MERALLINEPKQLGRLRNFERIYYGTEFCQNLIPSLDNLKKVFSQVSERGKKITLLTPYVTGAGLGKLERLFRYLDGQSIKTEVVFNEWGVFKIIRENYRNIEPVLGRLLTKQRRDPRASDILFSKQKAKRVADPKAKTTIILVPKGVPPSLYESFKASLINVPVFQKFLLANNIRRVEIDNLAWEMKIEVDRKIGVSIYLPYAYVTTTRVCGLLNLSYSYCGKECQRYYFSLKPKACGKSFYIRGNTIFYKSKMPDQRYLRKLGINRVVYNGFGWSKG